LAALVLWAGAGCVRVPTDAEKHKIVTHLITATANGQTLLRWDSQKDLIYTVLVGDRFTATQWTPLPNGANLRGTGAPIEMSIPENPNRVRTYKLMAVPVPPADAKR
jgi:hypothetical protein